MDEGVVYLVYEYTVFRGINVYNYTILINKDPSDLSQYANF